MARLTRKIMKIFGSTAGANQIAQFGSLANSTPNFTTDPAVVQGLTQWLQGWFSAAVGSNSPAIEDMNAPLFVMAYQLAYLFENGVPAWEVGTTYYLGSIVQDGTGVQYFSTLDNNTGNALSGTSWFPIGSVGPLIATIGTQTLPANRRISSPCPITLAAASTVTVPSTAAVNIPDSVIVPAGAFLIVAPGGSVRVI